MTVAEYITLRQPFQDPVGVDNNLADNLAYVNDGTLYLSQNVYAKARKATSDELEVLFKSIRLCWYFRMSDFLQDLPMMTKPSEPNINSFKNVINWKKFYYE